MNDGCINSRTALGLFQCKEKYYVSTKTRQKVA